MKLIMACDCGATGTRAGLYTGGGELLTECEAGPANAVEHGAMHCATLIAGLGRKLAKSVGADRVEKAAAGVAGAARPYLRAEIAQAARELLGAELVRVTDDLHPILLANANGLPAVVATAGTGSSVLAQPTSGEWLMVGGHGRVFGDEGSAYGIAVAALRAAANAFDGLGPETDLVDILSDAAGLSGFDELAVWAADASKHEIAGLARAVVEAAKAGDKVAFGIIRQQAGLLADQALAAARRLGLPAKTPVFMNGSMFGESQFYANAFKLALEHQKPVLSPAIPAKRRHEAVFSVISAEPANWFSDAADERRTPALPATERRLELGKHLDELEPIDMVRRMAAEDAGITRAVLAEAHTIAKVIDWVAGAIRAGGRLIYVGAGTSGRLGVLDASECPPTFGVAPERVVGLIAGGDRALRSSVEMAEDDSEGGAGDLARLNPPVGKKDVVVGVTASGRTPYVIGALDAGAKRGAKTALICCNPPVDVADETAAIVVETGAEVVAGSTRLKAGTATKMVLNMISTCAMARAGYVFEGYMVRVQPVSGKLADRAARILSALTGEPYDAAGELLQKADGDIGVAVLMARRGMEPTEARRVLNEAGGSLREALR